MSKKLVRYQERVAPDGYFDGMGECTRGEYVLYRDVSDLATEYNALREVGNKLAEYLLRALVDIEDWGCKTKREREVLQRWKELTEGGGESRDGGDGIKPDRIGIDGHPIRPALDCPNAPGYKHTYIYHSGQQYGVCQKCGTLEPEPLTEGGGESRGPLAHGMRRE